MAGAAVAFTGSGVQAAGALRGAGATFPSKVYGRWAREYAATGAPLLDYRPTGSGDGVRQAIARSVQIAGTDSPLSALELARHGLVQLPMLVGGVVPVVHLPEIDASRLRLNAAVLADLMAGRIARWDDPALQALNPGLNLPARRVQRVVRAEKSGTTEAFSRYLAMGDAGWAAAVGVGGLPAWPGEPLRAEGNDGVARAVRATPGAIGYVSADRAGEDGLVGVQLRNRDGLWVRASESGFRAAIVNSELHRQGLDTASLLDRPGPDSWPITLTSFVLVDASPARAEDSEAALRFLYWCLMRGDAMTRGTGFAPLPALAQARLAARFESVRPRDGRLPRYQFF